MEVQESFATESFVGPAFERHYSVAQVAELWSCSDETVRRLFQGEPGVIEICNPTLLPKRKRQREPRKTLKISASALERVHRKLQKQRPM
ncbi:MAG TPA: hypothetical protein VH437_09810 [Terriglobales bacterium]|jgi:hypothetical protein